MWAADLAAGETLVCRSIKAATISKYLADAARFIAGFTGEDPRFVSRAEHTIHPLIKGVINEVIRHETIPDKREPHTPAMQQWLRSVVDPGNPDTLAAAMADWGVLGLVLGPRISEWGQEEGHSNPTLPKLTPLGATYAFTWSDFTLRRRGNTRTPTETALTLPDSEIESVTVTFTWQKNANHGEKKLMVKNDASPDLCPVRAALSILRRFTRLVGTTSPTLPLAIYRDPLRSVKAITGRDVADALRRAAAQVYNIDPSTPQGKTDLARWSSHSLRVGACVLLHVNGFTSAEIQFLLRWKSDAFTQYLRNLGTLSRKQNAALTLTHQEMPNLL